jgi:hypothetical protein
MGTYFYFNARRPHAANKAFREEYKGILGNPQEAVVHSNELVKWDIEFFQNDPDQEHLKHITTPRIYKSYFGHDYKIGRGHVKISSLDPLDKIKLKFFLENYGITSDWTFYVPHPVRYQDLIDNGMDHSAKIVITEEDYEYLANLEAKPKTWLKKEKKVKAKDFDQWTSSDYETVTKSIGWSDLKF